MKYINERIGSKRVTGSVRSDYSGENLEATVSWACIGDVSPREAREFAQKIIDTANKTEQRIKVLTHKG